MTARILIQLVLGLVSLTLAAQQSFESKLNELLRHDHYKNASVGLQFAKLETGEILYSKNANTLFTPASTMKLLTSATALDMLGSDYRFKTVLGYSGKIKKRRVKREFGSARWRQSGAGIRIFQCILF